jgi:Uma2 family endonuclease
MRTVLPIDALRAPRSLVIDPPMSDAELEEFCRLNEIGRIERTKDGVILMNPPSGATTGDGNAEVVMQLRIWWKTHRRGRVYDSNTGFYLADGSMLSPDAAYLSAERLKGVTRAEHDGFPHVCPDFVVELFSRTDRRPAATAKMESWIANGARLGWLIDPYRKTVDVYEAGSHEVVTGAASIDGSGPVEGFALDLSEVWRCYEW